MIFASKKRKSDEKPERTAPRRPKRDSAAAAAAAAELLERRRRIIGGDRVLWVIFTALVVVSILVVYSSTAKMAYDISSRFTTTQSLRQQIMLVLLCIPAIVMVHKIDWKVFYRLTPALYWLFVGLTAATYFIGTSTNDAARWIAIGSIQFQPSEGLKVMTILMLARRMSTRQGNINKIHLLPTNFRITEPQQMRIIRENTWPLVGPVLLSCGVVVTAHTSSAVLIFIASLIMLYIGRVRIRELMKLTAVACVLGILLMSVLRIGRADVAGGRLSTWVKEWTTSEVPRNSYSMSDTQRAMIAIREGGLFGEGAGHSTTRALVTHPESDYAYSFFISEYGLVIALILMMLYLWIFFRSIEIFRACSVPFPALMTLGLGLLVTCQALLHIMVQVNLIPETGQNLPLISRGGSSLLFTTLALGMILSVSHTNELGEGRA